MKMHLAWIRVSAAAATTIASFGGQLAVGQSQYGPYAPAPQYATPQQYATQPPYSTQQATAPQYSTPPYAASQYAAPQSTAPRYSTVAPYGVQPTQQIPPAQPTQQPVYPTTSAATYYSAARAPYAPTPAQSSVPATNDRYASTNDRYASTAQAPQAPAGYQPPQYQVPGVRPTYPAVAQQPTHTMMPGTPAGDNGPQSGENLPAPEPAMNGADAQGYNLSSVYPAAGAAGGYTAGDAGCNNGGFDDYGYGLDGYMDGGYGGGSQWFGGVYGLYMTRSQPSYREYTVGVDTGVTGTPYFPQPGDVENMSDCTYLVPDWREGVEVRLGRAFGVGGDSYGDSYGGCGTTGCDSNACGCGPCCQQMYAVEAAWWGIDRDVQDQFVDGPLTATFRYYGMVNYAGLEYDDGTGGVLPVNDFYNYQIPITGLGSETVLSQRVRTNFTAQNFELNVLRLPLYTGGCGCGDCGQAFTLTGLCGLRYFNLEDDFEFATEWAEGGQTVFDGWGNGPNELFHDIQMENQLVGFQLGANMNYCVASRWNFFWDTNFGFYNNHINQYQRMYNPLNGPAIFTQDGRNATVISSKDEVAFLGEMRLGGGYLVTERWRATLAYRAIAISGVALAPDQIKPEYSNWTDTARINADGSIIIHGIQAGVECNF